MKKLFLLALIAIMIPAMAQAGFDKAGVAVWYYGLSAGGYNANVIGNPQLVVRGEVFTTEDLGPASFTEGDTHCVWFTSAKGWTLTTDPVEGTCIILDANTLWWQTLSVEVPCDAPIGSIDTVTGWLEWCGEDAGEMECIQYSDTILTFGYFEVVPSPPALLVLQDSLYVIEAGATTAYIPFSICNGDPCALPTDYDYEIATTGHITYTTSEGVPTAVPGGECYNVYGVLDAGLAVPCTFDTLTIITWTAGLPDTETVYDTCVQLVHVVNPVPVPLFTTPVVTILVLSMILAAAVLMKRRAASRA